MPIESSSFKWSENVQFSTTTHEGKETSSLTGTIQARNPDGSVKIYHVSLTFSGKITENQVERIKAQYLRASEQLITSHKIGTKVKKMTISRDPTTQSTKIEKEYNNEEKLTKVSQDPLRIIQDRLERNREAFQRKYGYPSPDSQVNKSNVSVAELKIFLNKELEQKKIGVGR